MIRSFFAALFCFVLILFCFPKSTEAYYFEVKGHGSYSDLVFEIHTFNLVTGSEFPEVGGKLGIDITARDASSGSPVSRFVTGSKYSLNLWPNGGSENACLGTKKQVATTTASADKLGFTLDLDPYKLPCAPRLSPGKNNFSLWLGDGTRDNNNTLINVTNIYLDQQGGGIVSIQPLVSDVNENLICPPPKSISVNLLGSKSTQSYSFWWDGARITADQINGTDQASSVINISKEPEGGPGQYKLCMMPDGFRIPIVGELPALNKCEQFVTFTKPNDPVKQCSESALNKTCQISLTPVTAGAEISTITKPGVVSFTITAVGDNYDKNQQYRLDLFDKQTGQNVVSSKLFTTSSTGRMNETLGVFPAGKYGLYIYNVSDSTRVCGNDNADVSETIDGLKAPVSKCSDVPTDPNYCASGAGAGCNPADGTIDTTGTAKGVMTAIGCIPTEPPRFIAGFMKYALGFGGGVALLLMIFGSFGMVTSSGNPDAIKKGREQFVSALIGLLFIIFSTLFLQILGVDILGLPGFTK